MSAPTMAFQLQAQLIDLIVAQIGEGGQMAMLQDVRPSAQFSTQVVPACAVMIDSLGDPQPFAQRMMKTTLDFEITLAANSVEVKPTANAAGQIADLGVAMQTLKPLIDDGNGNGIMAILTAPSTFRLGASTTTNAGDGVMQSRPGRGEFFYEVREGSQQSIWAYFVVHYLVDVQFTY
jgi:hypothetical protein